MIEFSDLPNIAHRFASILVHESTDAGARAPADQSKAEERRLIRRSFEAALNLPYETLEPAVLAAEAALFSVPLATRDQRVMRLARNRCEDAAMCALATFLVDQG